MFIRFDCGCLGLEVQGGDPVVVAPCDYEDYRHGFFRRTMGDKSSAPIDGEKADKLIEELGSLIADGYRFREIRGLLGR